MTTIDTLQVDPARLQQLTSEYARYSRSAGGLASVAGGIFCLLSYLAGGLLPPTSARQAVLILLPLLWLVGKQWLASRYYQRFGQVLERVNPSERKLRLLFAGSVAAVSIVISASVLNELAPFGTEQWTAAKAGYLVLILALPVIVWRWLYSPLDFVVGVFLACQAAIASTGEAYALWSSAIVFPAAALMMIAAGIREHRRFKSIAMQIRQISQARQVDV